MPTVAVIAIFVAITIAVAVAVTVAIVVLGKGAVEQQGHILVLALFVNLLQFGKHGTLQQAGADDEEGAVAAALDDLGVGHDLDL